MTSGKTCHEVGRTVKTGKTICSWEKTVFTVHPVKTCFPLDNLDDLEYHTGAHRAIDIALNVIQVGTVSFHAH